MPFLRLLSPNLRRAARCLPLAAVAAAVLAPAAHGAPTTLATEQRAAPVAAYAGTVVWSSYDATAKDYHLVVSRNGAPPQRLAGAPSPVPFDVDLGTNRSGATYAVYTRCAKPATDKNGNPVRGTGCDIYRLGLASGVEQRLQSLSSPTSDERDPTIFRGEIAFIRTERHRGVTQDVLRIGNTTSGSKGTRALVTVDRRATTLSRPELSFSRIAYVRVTRGGATQAVHVRTISSGSDRTVYVARSGGANAANIAGLSVDDRATSFLWARTNLGSGTGNRIVRYSTPTGKLSYALGSPRYVSSSWASQALGMAVMVDPSSTGTCSSNINQPGQCLVQLTGPLTFKATP